jgi:zinc protease
VPTGLGDVTPIHEARLENGMRLIVQENHAAPFVAIYGNLTAGPVFDPPDKAGLAAFCAEMLSRGTETRTWQQIREELEFVAAGLSFGTGVQVGTISGRCLTDDLKLLLGAASEQLMSPAFPEEEIEKVRSEIIAAQERRDEDTLRVAEKELLAQLYPQGHPLHYPRTGTRETVSAITRDDLEAFHGRYYRPENMILAIVGDVDVDDATRLVQDSFGRWESAGDPARPELPPVPAPSEPRTVRVPVPNKTQADIALGFPGLSRRDPGYYRADLMNYVLGRGFTSRMNMHIREDLGLAYYVWTYFASYWGAGPWMLQMGVDPKNIDTAVAAVLEELRQIQAQPPSEDELRLWKDYVEGTVARRMETYSGIARELVLAAFYDLGLYFAYEYPGLLQTITADDVHAAARDYLHPDGYVAVIAGPVEATED